MAEISVLMPVYNTPEEYLREAIKSVLWQTFRDWELIVVNDGSTNNAGDVIKSYDDPRIRFFENDGNKGLDYTRNRLLDLAQSPYLAMLDSDDRALPQRLEKQYAFMEANPEIGVCGSWFEYFPQKHLMAMPVEDRDIRFAMLLEFNPLGNSTVMLRRRILEENRLRYEHKMKVAEDYKLWLDLLDKTQFHNLPEVLVDYRIHGSNISLVSDSAMKEAGEKARTEVCCRVFGPEYADVLRVEDKVKNGEKISLQDLQQLERGLRRLYEVSVQRFGKHNLDRYRRLYKKVLRTCRRGPGYSALLWRSPLNRVFKLGLGFKILTHFKQITGDK